MQLLDIDLVHCPGPVELLPESLNDSLIRITIVNVLTDLCGTLGPSGLASGIPACWRQYTCWSHGWP